MRRLRFSGSLRVVQREQAATMLDEEGALAAPSAERCCRRRWNERSLDTLDSLFDFLFQQLHCEANPTAGRRRWRSCFPWRSGLSMTREGMCRQAVVAICHNKIITIPFGVLGASALVLPSP